MEEFIKAALLIALETEHLSSYHTQAKYLHTPPKNSKLGWKKFLHQLPSHLVKYPKSPNSETVSLKPIPNSEH